MKHLTLAALLALAACTDGPNAARVLEDAGYTDVVVGGYAAFSCDSKGDTFGDAVHSNSAERSHSVRGRLQRLA